MGSYSWNGTSGDWATNTNWTGGIPNSSTADVTIEAGGTYNVTIAAGESFTADSVTLANYSVNFDLIGSLDLLGSLASFNFSGSVFDLAGTISGGTFNIDTGTLVDQGGVIATQNFALGNQQYLDLNGNTLTLGHSAQLNGYIVGNGSAGNEILVTGKADLSTSYFGGQAILVDAGIVSQDAYILVGTAAGDTGGLVIDAGATYALVSDAYIQSNGTANISNAGLLEKTANVGESYIDGNFTNTGTIAVNQGTLDVRYGNDQLAGTITGPGLFGISAGANATLDSGLVINVATFNIVNGNATLGSSFDLTDAVSLIGSGDIYLNGHNLTLAGPAALEGTLTGPGTVIAGGTSVIDNNNLVETQGAVLVDAGVMNQDFYAYIGTLAGDSGGLVVNSGATYDIRADVNITQNGTANISNAGLFEKTSDTGASVVEGNFTNTGTLNVAQGQIDLENGTDSLSGLITGAGALVIYSGAVASLASTASLAIGDLSVAGNGSLALGGNTTLGNNFGMNNGTIELNGHQLLVDGSAGLNGYLVGPGTLTVAGNGNVSGLNVIGGAVLEDKGTLTQDSYLSLGNGGTDTGTLVVDSGATYDLIAGTGISRPNVALIANAGLFETSYYGFTSADGQFNNTGTIKVATGGTLQLDYFSPQLGGTIIGSGELVLNSDSPTFETGLVLSVATLDLTGGADATLTHSLTYAGQLITGNGSFNLNGQTLALTSPVTLGSGLISGPGEVKITGSGAIEGYLSYSGGALLEDAGTITQQVYNTFGTFSGDTATIKVDAGAVYDFTNDNSIGVYNNAGTNGSFINAGLLEKTGSTGGSDIDGNFTSTGTIDALTGYLGVAYNTASIGGTLTGNQFNFDQSSSGTFLAGLVLTVATLDVLNSSILALGTNFDYAGHLEMNTSGTVALNGHALTLGASASLEGLVTGNGSVAGGAVVIANRADLYQFTLAGGGQMLDTGTIVQDNAVNIDNSATDTASLTIAAAGLYDIANDVAINGGGAGGLINQGLLEKTGGTGDSYIYTNLTNSGTIDVVAGTIDLQSAQDLIGGTIIGGGALAFDFGSNATITGGAVLNIATIDVVSNALVTLAGNLTYSGDFSQPGGALFLAGHTLSLAGPSYFDGLVNGAGTVDVAAGVINAMLVGGGAILADTGSIAETNYLNLGNSATDSATLLIEAGATFNIINDVAINSQGNSAIDNAGLLEKTAANGTSYIYAGLTNTGAIAIDQGTMYFEAPMVNNGTVIDQGGLYTTGSVTGTGTIDIAADATANFNGTVSAGQDIAFTGQNAAVQLNDGLGAYAGHMAGTFTGMTTGDTIDLAYVLANGLSVSGNVVTLTNQVNGGAASLVTTLNIAGVNATELNLVQDGNSGTSIVFGHSGAAASDPTGGITTDTWNVASNGNFGNAANWNNGAPNSLSNAQIFTAGTYAVTVNAAQTVYQLSGNNGGGLSLDIASGGVLRILNNANTNFQGAVNIAAGGAFDVVNGYNLTGDVSLAAGGTLASDNGAIVLRGPSASLAGLITGDGTLYLTNGQTTLAAGSTLNIANLYLTTNETLTLESALNYAGQFTNASNATLALNGQNVSLAAVANLVGTVAGPGDITLGGGGDLGGGFYVTGGAALVDASSITMDGYIYLGNSASDTSSLIVNAGATFNILNDTQINSAGNSTLINAGLIEKTGSGGGSYIYPSLTSTGTIAVDSGTLGLVSGGALSGDITGPGVLQLYNGVTTLGAATTLAVATLDVSNNATLELGGAESYAGQFSITGGAVVALNGYNLTLTNANDYLGGQFVGPGTITVSNGADVNNTEALLSGAVLEDAGSIISAGQIYLGNGTLSPGSIVIDTGKIWNDVSDNAAIYDYSAGSGGILNNGLFEKTGGSTTSQITNAPFTNSSNGTISVQTGTLSLYGNSSSLAGLITGPGVFNVANETTTFQNGLSIAVGQLGLYSSLVLLESSRTITNNMSVSATVLDLVSSNISLTMTGSNSLTGNSALEGNGAFVIAAGSQSDFQNVYLQQGATLSDLGTIIQDGAINIGNSGTDSASLTIANTGVDEFVADTGVGNPNNSAFTNVDNAGQIIKTGSTGTSFIDPNLTSTGAIIIDTGTIQTRGSTDILGGVIIGPGAFVAAGIQTTLESNISITSGALEFTSNTTALNADLSYAGSFSLQGSTFAIGSHNVTLTNTTAVQGFGNSQLDGTGSLTLDGTGIAYAFYIENGAHFIDAGTLVDTYFISLGTNSSDSAVLSISGSGILDFEYDNEINGSGSAISIVNSGLIEKTAANGVSQIGPALDSSGIIEIATGTINLNNGGSLAGSLSGAGTFGAGGGTTTFASSLSLNVANIHEYGGGNILLESNRAYAGSFASDGGSNIALNGNTLTLSGNDNIGGNVQGGVGSVAAAGRMIITGTSDLNSGMYIYGGAILEDAGTIVMTAGIVMGNSAADSTTLSIDNNAVFNIISDNGFNTNGTAIILNNGLFEKTASSGNSYIYANVTNASAGTLAVDSGTVILYTDTSSLAGTVTGAGQLQLNSDTTTLQAGLALSVQSLNLQASTVVLDANLSYANSLYSNSDVISLNGFTLSLSGNDQLSGSVQGGAGSLSAAGKMLVNGTADINAGFLVYGGAILEDAGTIFQSNYVNLGNAASDSASLSIDAGAIYDIISDNGFNTNGTATISNAGLFEKTASTGNSQINALLDNSGTVAVDLGTLSLNAVTNDPPGTLTGGVWEAVSTFEAGATLSINSSIAIATDAANIILSGAGSAIISGPVPGTSLEASLTSVASAGTLQILADRNYLTANTLTDTGAMVLGGGTLAPGALSITSSGSLSGFGTVAAPIADNGEIIDTGPTLTLADTLTGTGGALIDAGADLVLGAGAAGTAHISFGGSASVLTLDTPAAMLASLVSLAPSDTIDLVGDPATGATISGGKLIVSLTAGGTLAYNLTSPDPLDRAVTSSDGLGGTDVVIFRQATAGALTPTPIAFGEHHVGTALDTVLTLSNSVKADPYSENLDATMASHSTGIIDAGSFTGLIPGATNATSLSAGLNTATDGTRSGTATVNLFTDGGSIAHDGLGSLAIGSESVTLTGTLFNLATASSAAPNPIAFGEHHVADHVAQALTLTNSALADGFSENLNAQFSGTTGSISTSGSISELGAGVTSTNALLITLASGNAGTVSGHTTIGLISDGSTIDTLGTTALAAQTINVTGTLFNFATASAIAVNPLVFGEHHVGDVVTQALTLANQAASGIYSEGLDAGFTATSGGITTHGSIATLAAGATNSSSLTVTLNTGAAGSFSGTSDILLTSDGTGIDTLANTGLVTQTLNASGSVFNYATASAVAPNPISFANHHVGDVATQALTLANNAAAGTFSEGLDASFGTLAGGIAAHGTITGLAAGASNASSLTVTLATGTAGSISGTADILLTSDGAGIDTLASTGLVTQTVSIQGGVYNFATASAAAPNPVAFGNHHVGDLVGAKAITLANKAAAGGFSEALDAKISTSSSGITAAGSITTLAAGSSNASSLSVDLLTGSAGAISGSAVITLTSDGTSIDGLGTTVLTAQTVNVTGAVYNFATASAVAPNPVTFGIVHVGDTASHGLTIANNAATGGFSEALDAGFGSLGTGINASGTISLLAAGASNSTSLAVGLNTGSAGAISGTAIITLASDGTTIDGLGTTNLAAETVTLSGVVNNYATATIEKLSGVGSLSVAGADYTLNLGHITQGASIVTDTLGILNSATGPADLLSGSFSGGSSPFTDSGFGSFTSIAAGSADTSPSISINAATLGSFSETIVLSATGFNASGYAGTLGAETLVVTADVTCFLAGTHILTDRGERLVEDLALGELVVTRWGALEPVQWIGTRRIDVSAHPHPARVLPVRIKRGAFAPNTPHRDLLVSPDHAILVHGKLIPARLLINHRSIVQETLTGPIIYFHIELARHDIVLSEGLTTETYLDTGNRDLFANGPGAMVLHPDLSGIDRPKSWHQDACAELVTDAAFVEPIWQSLADRAGERLGIVDHVMTSDDPDLHVLIDGQRITGRVIEGRVYHFDLPQGARDIIIASRAARPSDAQPWLDDRRLLGVAIGQIVADGVLIAPASYGQGWHEEEPHHRWTDGAAHLRLAEPALTLMIDVCGSLSYRQPRSRPAAA